jgi:hypothetical protein
MNRLSVRAAYYIGALVIPLVGAITGALVLLTTHYGDNLPLYFCIGAPAFIGLITIWFLLVQLPRGKLPKDWPDKPKRP